ncbi:exo-beta-N-acetylmuramidase NamZ domain-containing protein [Candidatus Neomarinimicrobiota bacterium]
MRRRIVATLCLFILLLITFNSCNRTSNPDWQYSQVYKPANSIQQFTTTVHGLDVLENDTFAPLQGKSVAILTNQSGVNRNGEHILDIIAQAEGVELKVIFAPEHGLAGKASAGEKVADTEDASSGVKVYSLYGETKKPTPEQLSGVDVVLVYAQHAGARYYTGPNTMTLVMEACAENNIPIWVLDRPSPIRGDIVDGPNLDMAYASFVGMHPVAVRHGLTLGELAIMINEEGWLGDSLYADLTVVPVVNWKRDMWWEETGLEWVKSSPNMPSPETALAYLGTCLFEGTNVSEGRGTYEPFLICGAPWIKEGLADILNDYHLPGVVFEDIIYTPRSIEGATNPKYLDEECKGVRLKTTNRDIFQPIQTGVVMIHTIFNNYAEQFEWKHQRHFDRLWGSDALRLYIDEGSDIHAHASTYAQDREYFEEQRRKYLIYEE